LISVLSEAYQLTKKERYKQVIEETVDFIKREMMNGFHAFYSALDADSEGEEGKFYVWNKKEVEEIIGDTSKFFCKYYDIIENGNWEGKNILRIKKSIEDFSMQHGITVKQLSSLLFEGRKKLLEYRSQRVRPQLDDKVILGWNALMNTACSKAFAATGIRSLKQLAIDNMEFLLEALQHKIGSEFYHTWKNDRAKYPAFLDDYAFLIEALLELQQITADTRWLEMAKTITEFVIENFSDEQDFFFYYTKNSQNDVIVRKKEIYDGAVPSGNSIMAYNLHRLSIYFDQKEWKKRSEQMIAALHKAIIRYPTSFGIWACLLQEIWTGTNEIVLSAKDPEKLYLELLREYIPNKVVMVADGTERYPLVVGKPLSGEDTIWLCREFSCLPAVNTVTELISLIDRAKTP
jgi:uncharacterized protein YyaL (SSP411 family)